MKVRVFSEKEIKRKELKDNIAIISISSPGLDGITFNAKNVFYMKFFDLENDFGRAKAPKEEDMQGLKEFLDKVRENGVEEIYINCEAGISRSAGVAAAVESYFGLEDTIFCSSYYVPNIRVYRLCLQELGLEEKKSDKYFSLLF